MTLFLLLVIGLAAGVLSVLLGVGGGIIIVPALVYLVSMDMKLAAGTSLAVIIPTAILGAYKKAQVHSIDWRFSLIIAVGALIGVVLGERINAVAPEILLKRLFAVLLIVTAARMLMPGR